MLFDPRYHRVHYAVIALSLLVHLSLHYATYIPMFRGPLGGLPYFRLHILHEAEFLLIVSYAGVVIGVRAGIVAIIITGVTSIPSILTPYIFGRDPRPNEIRDLIIQVVFIMLMGYLITLLYDRDKRRRVAENLRDTMAQMDQLRSNFVAMAAHELRTPMTTIMGFSELLLSTDIPPDDAYKWLTSINQESRRLAGLVEEMLSVSSIEAGRVEVMRERLVWQSVIDAALWSTGQPPEGISRVIDAPDSLPDVWADADKLKQVLVNLISNAYKYSPQGGVVTLRAQELPEGMLRVSIADQGLGISEEDQAKLFTTFYRMKSNDTRHIPGTGLGLYITKSLVDMMGGTVELHSSLGIGFTFSFTVPTWTAEREAESAPQALPEAA
jgi:signal transduction histidine kinase